METENSKKMSSLQTFFFLKNQNISNAEFSWVTKYGLGSVTSEKFIFATQTFS